MFNPSCLSPAGENKIQRAGHAGPVQLARLLARYRHKFLERIEFQSDRHRDADNGIGHARDRSEIAGFIGQVIVQERVRRE